MNAALVTEMLVNRGMLDSSVGDDLRVEATSSGKDITQLLVEYAIFSTPEELYATIAEEIGATYYDLEGFEPPADLVSTVPAGMARLHGAMPVNISPEGLYIAFLDPLDAQAVEDMRFALGREIQPVVAKSQQIEKLIERFYGSAMDDPSKMFEGMVKGGQDEKFDLAAVQAEVNSAPIIRYVDLVLFQAIRERASDIHFEPFENEFRIRYRVDGALYEMAPPPAHLTHSIISRIKVMSNMNIAERRLPQDGRIMKMIDDRQVDMRVNSLPTQHGESVVLRVLDRSSVNLDLRQLNLPPYLFDYILETVTKPNGIFIATGPTGAGKTTTLYACLKEINTIDSKLLTAEDPVEYDIEGIIQIPVNEAIGLTFSRALRAFLRQDPDRIMVGEMRDKETASIAIQASLTGHLVFSTLHTNDAPGAVTRLIDMGCEPFMVAATMEGILAQRLLRTICKNCRTPYQPTDALLGTLGLSINEIGDKQFYTGAGCEACSNTGYKGRKGLYELLDVSDPIRELITERAPTLVLRQKAIELGMIGLREDGLRNIYDGETTIEEVLKYT